VFFGLLDSDGWIWASLKAGFWMLVIIMILGYLPDRAYYFTVFSTIDLGMNPQAPPASYVTPINLCPAENQDIACPPQPGAILPWQPSPAEIALPTARTDGSAIQVGTKLLFAGGSDGTSATAESFVAEILPGGATFDAWQPGPALPEPRTNATTIFAAGTIYMIGGLNTAGEPQTSVWSLTTDPDTGEFGEWTVVDALTLPEGRAGASVAAAPDGLVLAGGTGPNGPTTTVLKSSFDPSGALTAWVNNVDLPEPRTDASAGLVGDFLYVYGGSDGNGNPTATVLRGDLTTPEPDPEAAPGTPADPASITGWAVATGEANLPVARTNAAGFTTNGALYLIGGSDGSAPKGEVYWTVPSAQGDIEKWQTAPQSNLPAAGLMGGAPVVSGSTAFVVGGQTTDGVLGTTIRSNLAPQKPFFQLGLLGVTVPALKIEGEIGQQLGYMNAALVGTAAFILLVLIGLAFAFPDRTRQIWDRLIRRGG
jgi:hypothetical protein